MKRLGPQPVIAVGEWDQFLEAKARRRRGFLILAVGRDDDRAGVREKVTLSPGKYWLRTLV